MANELARTARLSAREADAADTYTKAAMILRRKGIDVKRPFEAWVDRDGSVVYRQ